MIHDFDMIYLSKSYLDSSVSSGNDNHYIKDYKLVRADHPGNVKMGGVWVYFKESLPVSCLTNVLYLKYLLTIRKVILSQCTIRQVKFLMILTHLPLIWRNL